MWHHNQSIRWVILLLGLTLAQAFFWGAQGVMAKWVFVGEEVFFVDGDCYARMQRAAMIAENPGTIIREHSFENHPQGTRPHTTALLDYGIAGFSIFQPGDSAQRLDRAGAWISPVIGAILLGAATLWVGWMRLPAGWAVLLLLALSPILLHGFSVGRPDHQSLALFLVGLGWMLELARFRSGSTALAVAWGIIWGLALWTSLFEPLILLIGTQLLRFVLSTAGGEIHQSTPKSQKAGWLSLGVVALLFLTLEGWPALGAGGASSGDFANWGKTIGELQRTDPFKVSMAWIGWLGPILPLLLGVAWFRKKDRASLFWGIWIVALAALTFWHGRWGYFFALAGILSLPWALGWIPRAWLRYVVFVFSLWPMGVELERVLYPSPNQAGSRIDRLQEAASMRQLSQQIKGQPGDGILAPWWVSPMLSYWTRLPSVAGSSHQSLPGILDSARFFSSTSFEEGRQILEEREVRFVITLDADRVSHQSATILGQADDGEPNLARRMQRNPSGNPAWLREVTSNHRGRLFEVLPEESGD